MSHPTLGAIAWRYLIDRWGDITERFPTNALPRMIEGIRWLTDDAVADPDAERGAPQFLARHPLGSGDQLVQQSLELQAVHRALVERSRPSLGGLIAQRPRRCLVGPRLPIPAVADTLSCLNAGSAVRPKALIEVPERGRRWARPG